jgi:predicted NBD/HSP70 family sugar kinase
MRKIDLTSFQVATSETARDINRRIVLDLIRTRQPISRADLARCSGLQRSTISLITEQLISEQWVTEGSVGNAPRGRKPRFLHLNTQRAGIVGINVRPSATTIALADLNSKFVAQETIPTATDPDVFIRELVERVSQRIKAHPHVYYEGIGVSLPGRIDQFTKRLVFAPNLGWRDVDLKTPLYQATGVPVEVENAANACALAEIWFDRRAENVRDLIAVTVSEGVGTGIIMNGQLVRGPGGIAGEFGHVSIDPNGELCKCGNRGCWEVFASNTAAIKAYLETNSGSRHPRRASNNPQMPELTFEDLLQLYEQGDNKAGEALDRMAHYMGLGMAMLITGLAPQIIVVVGEITRAWHRVGPIINKVVAERSPAHAVTRIVPAEDAAQPRLRGTVALILQQHFSAPSIA